MELLINYLKKKIFFDVIIKLFSKIENFSDDYNDILIKIEALISKTSVQEGFQKKKSNAISNLFTKRSFR